MRRGTASIAAVVTLPRDPGLCRIELTGGTAPRGAVGPIRRDDAERLGLRVGAAWTAALARRVAVLVESTELRRRALLALGRSAVSEAQLEARLRRRGASAAVVRSVLDQLRADGWLDDRRSAADRASSITRRGAFAATALDALLDAEGFRERDRRAAVEATAPDDRRSALAEARRGAERGESASATARRLSRRGFDADIIEEVLRRTGRALEEPCE